MLVSVCFWRSLHGCKSSFSATVALSLSHPGSSPHTYATKVIARHPTTANLSRTIRRSSKRDNFPGLNCPFLWPSPVNISKGTCKHRKYNRRLVSFSTQIPRMSVHVRGIEAGDKPTWLGLWEQYNEFYERKVSTEVTDNTFSRFLDGNVRMYGAVAVNSSDKKVIGFVHWYPHLSTSTINEVVYLHDLFVDPSIRNKGAGRALIEHVYEHAKTIPASSVYWHTQFFNHRAQLLYVKVADRTDFVQYRKML